MPKNDQVKKEPVKKESELIKLLTDIRNVLIDNNYLLEILVYGEEEDPTVATKEDYGIDLNDSAITGTFLDDDSDEGLIIKYTPKK